MESLKPFLVEKKMVLECNDERVDVLNIVSEQRPEIIFRDKDGHNHTLVYYPEYGGWKPIFNMPGNQKCIDPGGKTYQIRRYDTADEMGAKSLDDIIGAGLQ